METSPRQLCDDLIALLKHIKANLGVLAEKHGLTHMQLHVLNVIRGGDITMGELAGNLHCDASNVTGMVDRLVASGLVDRRESEHDRRAKVLQLTATGHEVLETITKEMPVAIGCGRLKPAERTALHQLIARIV